MLMILNIQIGEFYNEDNSSIWEFFWSFLTVFSGAAIPLYIFYRGNREADKDKEAQKKENRDNSLKYFSQLLKSVISVSETQAEECKIHATNLKEKPLDFHLLKYIAGEDLNRILNRIEHERIFHAYLDKFDNGIDRIKKFQQIFSHLDLLDKIYLQVNQSQEKQINNLRDRLNSYKELTEEHILKYCSFILYNLRQEGKNETAYFTTINKIVIDYHTNSPNPITFDYIQEKLVNELKSKVLEFNNEPGYYQIMDNCRKATWLHYEIVQRSLDVSNEFLQYSDYIKKSALELKELSLDISM